MITYLKVVNLAIVELFTIEPGPGLNVLTGETGAGKSLLIDSLEFLRGARGSTELVRGGEEKMTAEAVFDAPGSLRPILDEMGIEADSPRGRFDLVIRREFSANGRSRVIANGSVIAVRELERLTDELVEIHGQNQSTIRIAGKSFLELLDQFAGNDEAIEATRAAWAGWKESADALEALTRAEKDRAQRLEILTYQINEIEAAHLDPAEEDELRSERSILANAEELAEVTAEAHAMISEDDLAAISLLAKAEHRIDPLGERVAALSRIRDEIRDARFRLEETARSLADLADSIRHDPARLAEVEDRLAAIDRLRRKYGDSVPVILRHLDEITKERDELVDYEASLDKARRAERNAIEHYRKAAGALSAKRREAAPRFERAIGAELRDLAMEKTTIRLTIDQATLESSPLTVDGRAVQFGPEGWDRATILASPNPGEELKPLQKIVSGGELSRMQLAIAATLFRNSMASASATLVFDEIDAGIGGRVAEVVGRKLRELGERHQVICVTHLPQIASLADTQFTVWKESDGERTRARIALLAQHEQRVEEIARMLAGTTITESARKHAAELLARAGKKRR